MLTIQEESHDGHSKMMTTIENLFSFEKKRKNIVILYVQEVVTHGI